VSCARVLLISTIQLKVIKLIKELYATHQRGLTVVNAVSWGVTSLYKNSASGDL